MTKKNIQITVSGSTVTHLWHFRCWSAHHFLLPDFLFDEDTGHVEGAQQSVGLEPQRVALRRQQLQGVQCRVQVVAATQLNQQVHQRLTKRGRKRDRREEREKVKERVGSKEERREGFWKKEPWGETGNKLERQRGKGEDRVTKPN